MELDLRNLPTSLEDFQDVGVASLFEAESHHAPSSLSFCPSDYRFCLRRTVLSLVSRAKSSYDLNPFLVYLAVNYVDQFLSKQEIPKLMMNQEKRPWMSHILVMASFSLAAKMTNADISVPLSRLQREEGFEVDSQWVHRMEKVLLTTLQWRMRPITPFSFLQYFISISGIDDPRLAQHLTQRASDIIFDAQQQVQLLVYKPSTMAAAAVVCSIQELMPLEFPSSEAAISWCEYLDKDAVLKCVGTMQEITRNGFESSSSATESGTLTPVGEAMCKPGKHGGYTEFDKNDVKRPRFNGVGDKTGFMVSSESQQC